MIKKLSKLTVIMILMGAILVGSAVACQSRPRQEGDKFDDWGVDWGGYKPNVRPPQTGEEQPPDVDVPDNDNGEEAVTPPSELTPITKPITYTAMIKSGTDSLNVRSAPSTGGQVLGSLDKGDMVRYEGLQNGWYKTVYKQRTAYIYAGNNYASIVYMKQGEEKWRVSLPWEKNCWDIPTYGEANATIGATERSIPISFKDSLTALR